MTRSLNFRELLFAAALALVGIVSVWLIFQQDSQAAASVTPVDSSARTAPALAAGPDAGGTQLVQAPAPRPDGLRLPSQGTPTIAVRDGETLALHSSPGGDVVAELASLTEFGSPTVLSVADRRGNWAGVPTELLPNGELAWVRLDSPAAKLDSVGVSIVVDLSEMRGELLRGNEVEHSWTVSIGTAESPTPTGRFSVTDVLTEGFNSTYGCCVLALSATQPNLPEGWTGGNRMAVHGTTDALGQANSSGCVRSGEDDLQLLVDRVPLGTPVTIQG